MSATTLAVSLTTASDSGDSFMMHSAPWTMTLCGFRRYDHCPSAAHSAAAFSTVFNRTASILGCQLRIRNIQLPPKCRARKPAEVRLALGLAQAEPVAFGITVQVPGDLIDERLHQDLSQLDQHDLHDLVFGFASSRCDPVSSQIFNLPR